MRKLPLELEAIHHPEGGALVGPLQHLRAAGIASQRATASLRQHESLAGDVAGYVRALRDSLHQRLPSHGELREVLGRSGLVATASREACGARLPLPLALVQAVLVELRRVAVDDSKPSTARRSSSRPMAERTLANAKSCFLPRDEA